VLHLQSQIYLLSHLNHLSVSPQIVIAFHSTASPSLPFVSGQSRGETGEKMIAILSNENSLADCSRPVVFRLI